MRSDKGPWKDPEILRVGPTTLLFYRYSLLASLFLISPNNFMSRVWNCSWLRMGLTNVQKNLSLMLTKRKQLLR